VPYCRKCGTKLDDDARFCYVCGTPVTPVASQAAPTTPAQTRRRTRRTGFPIAATVLIIIMVLAFVVVVVAFLPYHQVNFNQSNEASAANVDSLRLTVSADIANVNIILRDLPGNQRAATNVSATGWRGIFGNDRPLALTFDEDRDGSTLMYSVNVSRAEGWSVFNMLEVTCDVYVDPSVSLIVTVNTSTGSITMDADRTATFQHLVLHATTGSVEIGLKEDVTIAGELSLEATTGSVHLLWDETEVSGNIPVNLRTTTGSVEVNVTRSRQLAGNVTLNAEATTGSVNLALDIQSDVGARISASTGLGGVNIEQDGFSGNEAPLQSNNYPAGSNFNVTLSTTTGSVNINAVYDLGGTRS
jgi:hypothetical protein